ncbi:hypothetical protein I4U23_011551 [Adineta vaga]|nr:hypothetical protein I4U23_011551 [Adineta vaga]
MSSNSSDAVLIATLAAISTQINRYMPIIIFLFGTIGNLLNCLALSQRTLRSNPCALLFLASSIASLITLISGISVRFLTGWSADLTETIDWICKIRFFVLSASRTIAFWLITLAMVDRWLSSSIDVHRRQMSTLKNAQRSVIFIIILSSLAYAHYFYCFEANLKNTPLKCYGKTVMCRLAHDLEFALVTVLIPSSLMIIFGVLTVFNVHRSAMRRVRPIVTIQVMQRGVVKERLPRVKKIEHQLLVMLSVQTTFVILFSLPQVSISLHRVIILEGTNSPVANAISNFLLNLFILFTYITNGMPFYVYTLSGGTVFLYSDVGNTSCYSTFGTTRTMCNGDFLNCTRNECATQRSSSSFKCLMYASTLYSITSIFGIPSFMKLVR